MSTSQQAREVATICARISPLLAGHPPEVQGAVLADLLAMWLAGHPEPLREAILTYHIDNMRPLIAVNAAIIRGH